MLNLRKACFVALLNLGVKGHSSPLKPCTAPRVSVIVWHAGGSGGGGDSTPTYTCSSPSYGAIDLQGGALDVSCDVTRRF